MFLNIQLNRNILKFLNFVVEICPKILFIPMYLDRQIYEYIYKNCIRFVVRSLQCVNVQFHSNYID